MKTCSHCGKPAKPKDSYCAPCRAAVQRAWRERHREAIRESRQLDRAAKNLALATMVGGACMACGVAYTAERAATFDLHHRDPATRAFRFGGSLTRAFPALVEEAKKCDLLCANCHRFHHTDEPTRRWYARMGPEIQRMATEYLAKIQETP